MTKNIARKAREAVSKKTHALFERKSVKKVLNSQPVKEILIISGNHRKKLWVTFWIPGIGAPICVSFIISIYTFKTLLRLIRKKYTKGRG